MIWKCENYSHSEFMGIPSGGAHSARNSSMDPAASDSVAGGD